MQANIIIFSIVPTIIITTFLIVFVIYKQNRSLKGNSAMLSHIIKTLKIKSELEKLKYENVELTEEIKLSSYIFYTTNDSVAMLDGDGNYISVNPAFEKITEYTGNELKGKHFSLLNSGKHDLNFYKDLLATASKIGFVEQEVWHRRKSGELFTEKLKITRELDPDTHSIKNYMIVSTDITEEKDNESKIAKMAKHDPLTQLPNRALFMDRLERSLLQSKRNQSIGALMFLDLDHFKSINDTFGHQVGDLLLLEIAERLKTCVRESDTVARLAGDEFTIILPQITRSEDAAIVADNIINQIIKEYDLGGNKIRVTCSVGISIFPNDGFTCDEIIHAADQAMYNVKKEGRNQFKFYSSSLDSEAHRKKSVEKELLNAISKNELYLEYLPAFDINKNVSYFDVLVRWHHPTFGDIKPNEFIPLAEESGLIMKITDWVIKRALIEFEDSIHILKEKDIKLSFKLSSVHFKQNDIIERMVGLVTKDNIALIQIKIDEPILSKNLMEAKEKISSLIEKGFKVCIDDFGTGKLSFLDILDLKFNCVKIPRELVKNIDIPSYSAAIISLISLAKNLDVSITIEGIETEKQIQYIEKYMDEKMFLQGHFFSKPMLYKQIRDKL